MGILKDISSYMIARIEGGYHLDTVEHNNNLISKFIGSANFYSNYQGKKKKISQN